MLLDPKFKNVTFVSSDILIPELVEVASNILSVPSESQSTAESTSTPAPKRQKTHRKLMMILNDFLQHSDNITDPTEKLM